MPGGLLLIYGPFKKDGKFTTESNESFDRSLRSRNPAWGLRNLEDLYVMGAANALTNVDLIDMPANNFMVIFKKQYRRDSRCLLSTQDPQLVTHEEVLRARDVLLENPLFVATPILRRADLFCPALRKAGVEEVILKLEGMQFTGSFKLRGSLNQVLPPFPYMSERIVLLISYHNLFLPPLRDPHCAFRCGIYQKKKEPRDW